MKNKELCIYWMGVKKEGSMALINMDDCGDCDGQKEHCMNNLYIEQGILENKKDNKELAYAK